MVEYCAIICIYYLFVFPYISCSTFRLTQIVLLWTHMYLCLLECLLPIILGIHVGLEVLDHVRILWLTFWGSLFAVSVDHITFPSECLNISTSSSTFIHFHVFYSNCPSGCKVISCGFYLHFSNDFKHFFVYFLVTCILSLEKCLFKSFANFPDGMFDILLLSWKCSLYILNIVVNSFEDSPWIPQKA